MSDEPEDDEDLEDEDEDDVQQDDDFEKRWAEREKEIEESKQRRRQYTFVMPECCQTMIDTAAVVLLTPEGVEIGKLDGTPKWGVRTGDPREGYYDTFGFKEAKFCPFCGQPVPEIERRTTDRKVMVVTDGGYYCDTCGERCNCCSCLPLAFHWQPKGSSRTIPEIPRYDDEDEEEDDDEGDTES